MANYSTENHKYSYLWSKYRPAILKLMVDADNGPQEYQFSKHEFHNINAKEKGGYAFTLRLLKGKSIDPIKTSVLAQDLLVILQQSRRCSELSSETTYEFKMDKTFLFHVTKEESELTEEEIGEPESEEKQEKVD